MHGKSTRVTRKASAQKQTELSNKKSSHHSKRNRKSSTSSKESSDDENTCRKTHDNTSRNGSPESDKPTESEKNDENIQPTHTTSSRRTTRKQLSSQVETELRSSPRKRRNRGLSAEHSQDENPEDKDDKTNKGKSKSKHRSKNEKQPQIQDVQAKTESEISENVQVTRQSPHSNIDIPVDKDTECDKKESDVPIDETTDDTSIPHYSNTKPNNISDFNDSEEGIDNKQIENNVEDEKESFETKTEDNTELRTPEQVVVLDMLPIQTDSEMLEYQEEVLQSETSATEGSLSGTTIGNAETRSKSSSPEPGIPTQIIEQQNVQSVDSNNGEPMPSDDDLRSPDAIILHESSNTPPRDTKFTLTKNFQSDVHHNENVNTEIQIIKDIVKTERKHKWGNSLIGFELLKPSMKNITIETIKEFCPNVALLDENEIRLAAEHREKKVERHTSMEYKSDIEANRRFDTQSSHEETNSENDSTNIIALNRKISIVEDTASKLQPPPSPAKNPVSNVLFITNLVRPFTLKQLKELLERTGTIQEDGFWTDHIKSKCYVCYETSEEAEATRNALHGVSWPIGNGKQLMIEYSTFEEFAKAKNPAPTPVALEKPPQKEKENIDIEKQFPVKRPRREETERLPKEREPRTSEGRNRDWDSSREEVRHRRSHSRRHSPPPHEVHHNIKDRNERRRSRRRSTPPGNLDYRSKKQKLKEEPQKLMDDLFHKTKAAPSVYWLPLTPEEIATKQQERLLRMAEHKRRIEESVRSRGDHGRGAPYRRRYD